MALRFEDRWIWDFWFAKDGADYHIFYLQAPRSLVEQTLRHWHVTIGHAVSQDLRNWTVLPDAFAPSTAGDAWDNYTTWTGSITQHEGLWYLFYTGSHRAEDGLIQRVGYATSDDLMTWTRAARNPVIEADARWYELLDRTAWHDQAWRDPWVFRHPQTGEWHAYITARAKDGPADGRGVIGHATSPDLKAWAVREPITAPGEFGDMEVPQLAHIDGRYYLFFSTPKAHHSAMRRARTGLAAVGGTHYLVGESPLGPFSYITDAFMVGDDAQTLYSGKVIEGPDGQWVFLAFRNFDASGAFLGDIIDPLPVTVGSDGRLTVG